MSPMRAHTLAGCSLLFFVSTATAQVFAPAVSYTIGPRSYVVAPADMDGDVDVDLAASQGVQNALVILKNNAHGIFSVDSAYSVGIEPGGIVPADLDHDGDLDLAVTDYSSHTGYILLNDGHGVSSMGCLFASGGANAH